MYENETSEVILERTLGRIPGQLDKRESSFLYNASAAIALEHGNLYLALENIRNITNFSTSDRSGKIERCRERGIDISQFDATHSVVVIEVTPAGVVVPIGTRFSHDMLNFTVTEQTADGKYLAQCETLGTSGNVTGDVVAVEYINGLSASTITEIHQYGEDEADLSEIDSVYYASFESQAFGGNKADYKEKIKKIPGVGGVKVYSAAEWQGGGTVKCVITTSAYTVPSESFVDSVQTTIDPVQNHGAGLGLAPIGHTVTIAGVTTETVNVGFTVQLQTGYTLEDITEAVNTAIDSYLLSLSESWEDETNLIVRISQIETRLLGVTGIVDIADTTLNGEASNLTISADAIPIRGSVSAN